MQTFYWLTKLKINCRSDRRALPGLKIYWRNGHRLLIMWTWRPPPKEIFLFVMYRYSTLSVAQLTLHLFLNLFIKRNRLITINCKMRELWVNSKDFSYGFKGLFELSGKTIAIIGLARLVWFAARIAEAFGMKVIASVRNPSKYELPNIQFWQRRLFSKSRFCEPALSFTDDTRQMVNEAMFALMKPTLI